MLAVWRAADDIELFESGWIFDHFYPIFSDPTGPCLEGWITLTRPRPGDEPPAPRDARDRHPLPAPGRARQHGGHRSTSSREAGSSSASGPAGTRRSRVPTASPSARRESAATVSRRPARSSSVFSPMRRPRSRAPTTSCTEARCNPKPVQRPHPPICIGGNGEQRTLAHSGTLRPALELPRRLRRRSSPTSARCSTAIAPTSGATRGRSYSRAMCASRATRRDRRDRGRRSARPAASSPSSRSRPPHTRSARAAGGGPGRDRLSGARGKTPADGRACCDWPARQ